MDELLATTVATIASQYLGTESPTDPNDEVIEDLPRADEISEFSRPLLTFAAVMTILIMLTGIFGNILTTVALLKCPKVRNVAAAFIISLCIADCIFCAVVLPFSAFRFIQGTWTHGDFLCKLIPFIQYGNVGVSLLCIAMITINRYIMIAHHSAYAKIYKRHWIGAMIVFCWVFSYGMQLPTLLGVWGEFGFDKKLGTCSIIRDQFGHSSKAALFAIAFVTPCIIIIACYARIFWVVHESEVRMRKHAHKQNTIPNNMRKIPSTNENTDNNVAGGGGANRLSQQQISTSSFDTSGNNDGGGVIAKQKSVLSSSGGGVVGQGSQKSMRIKDQRDAKAKRNEWRITKMVLAIFLSFVGCYLPITLVKVVDQNVGMPGFHIFAYIMLYLSSCINPIIYVIMNKQYRQAYKTVLMCKPSRLLAFTNAGSSAGEMERHRIQLQPQSYHGITGIPCRPKQCHQHKSKSTNGYGGTNQYKFNKTVSQQQQQFNNNQQYQQQLQSTPNIDNHNNPKFKYYKHESPKLVDDEQQQQQQWQHDHQYQQYFPKFLQQSIDSNQYNNDHNRSNSPQYDKQFNLHDYTANGTIDDHNNSTNFSSLKSDDTTANISPTRIATATATIYSAPRFSASRYSHYIGRGGYNSGGGGGRGNGITTDKEIIRNRNSTGQYYDNDNDTNIRNIANHQIDTADIQSCGSYFYGNTPTRTTNNNSSNTRRNTESKNQHERHSR